MSYVLRHTEMGKVFSDVLMVTRITRLWPKLQRDFFGLPFLITYGREDFHFNIFESFIFLT